MNLRIHGDNIIECERALQLVALAYNAEIVRESTCIYLPVFSVEKNGKRLFEVELFAGHDRWNVSIAKILVEYGAPLREATDAYITKIIPQNQEQIYLAIEFCNALPAGNNAWQRSGRAISSAEVGIPYFYYAEVGGVELDSDRQVKAPRFPNPIVPFSYLTATATLKVICIPIYEAHPAITPELREKFASVFGLKDSLKLIKCLLDETDGKQALQILIDKGTALVEILSHDRKRIDTFKGNEWKNFLKMSSGFDKAKWLAQNSLHLIWQKKQSDKVNISSTFKKLITEVQALNCLSVGAKEIPICLIPATKIGDLTKIFHDIYPNQTEFYKQFSNYNKSFIIVWVTGFKPQGDDSRPDRGLVPLARMLFGNEIDILTIVYGPAKESTWKLFAKQPEKLAEINGLWEAVLNLSNFVFIDSATSAKGAMFYEVKQGVKKQNKPILFEKASTTGEFSEHDTDTAIHSLFSNQTKRFIFESMCNPPGGDWSGVSVFDFAKKQEYRWTSLPRVSAVEGKRPDHIIQLLQGKETIFLAIESKNNAKDLEANIGERLVIYVKELLVSPPTAYKLNGKEWQISREATSPMLHSKMYSGASFSYKNIAELISEMAKGKLDFIIAFEFKQPTEASILHLKTHTQCQFLNNLLAELCKDFGSGLEIEIH